MTERAYRYRDPLEVLISEESRTCKGCIWLSRVWGMPICRKKNNDHAKNRCKHYEEREPNA